MKGLVQKHWRPLLVGVLSVFAAVQLFLLFLPHRVFWDEAVYLGMGRYLGSLGASGLWEPLRPVLLPLVLSVFSHSSLYFPFASAISLIFSLGALLLLFVLTERLFDKATALFSVALMAFSPAFFTYSSWYLTGIPALALGLLAVVLALDRRYFWAGLAAGLSFLMRFPAGLFFAGIGLWLFFSRAKVKELFSYLLGFLGPVALFLAANLIAYGNMLTPFLAAGAYQYSSVYSAGAWSFWYYLVYPALEAPLLFGFLVFLFLPREWRWKRWALLLPCLLLLTYFSLIVNKQVRFSLLFLPLLAIGAVRGLLFLRQKWRWGSWWFLALVVMLVIPMVYFDGAAFHNRTLTDPAVPAVYSKLPAGTVYTTTPLPAAYTTHRFVPLYTHFEDFVAAYPTLKAGSVLLYTPSSFPCSNCTRQDAFLAKMTSENTVLLHATLWQEYYVFRIR